MSSAITIAAVGVAASAYSANQAKKRAEKAASAGEAAYADSQGVARELKLRQETLVDPVLKAKIAEFQGRGLTTAGQMSQDRFSAEMAVSDKKIQEDAPLAGEGVTGGRQLTQSFRRAQGLAGINLVDQASKDARLGSYLGMAQQAPAWAGSQQNANTQMGAFQTGLLEQANREEQSAYASAAQGLGAMSKAYAAHYAKDHPDWPVPEDSKEPKGNPEKPGWPFNT
jgi:hypothetical protein